MESKEMVESQEEQDCMVIQGKQIMSVTKSLN